MMQLGPRAVADGYRLTAFEVVGSTNDAALDAAEAGDAGFHWFVAGQQTAGRGRSGRVWQSPPGNLYASLLLVQSGAAERLPQLGFVFGLAAHRAVRALCPGADARLSLKWPNDLLLDGAKAGGLLLEVRQLPQGRWAVAAGIGLNLTSHPQETPYPATDLAASGLGEVLPTAALHALGEAVPPLLTRWNGGASFGAVLEEWRGHAHGIGHPVEVLRGSAPVSGRFETVDERGRLMLMTSGGLLAIDAADVFFPGGAGRHAP